MVSFMMLLVSVGCLADSSQATRIARASDCSKYSEIISSHTMCKEDVGRDIPLSDSEKQDAVDLHNKLRGRVTPSAANMLKLVWDEELAVVAAKWARQCKTGHDKMKERMVPSMPGLYIGQNFGAGYGTDLQYRINSWFNEYKNFKYGKGAKRKGAAVGHYTQVVNFRASRIGCGQAYCPDSGYYNHQVCNYAGGQEEVHKPYKKGDSCSACPSGKCENKLCDCGGLLCYNGGTIDSKTCSCQCPSFYTGSQCETEIKVDCPVSDSGMCTMFPPEHCRGDWVTVNCPILCKKCPAPPNCEKRCKNGAVLNKDCQCECYKAYSGDTCEQLSCPAKPLHDICSLAQQDTLNCQYWNVKFSCPRLCGLC